MIEGYADEERNRPYSDRGLEPADNPPLGASVASCISSAILRSVNSQKSLMNFPGLGCPNRNDAVDGSCEGLKSISKR